MGNAVTARDPESGEVAEHKITAVLVNADPEIEHLWLDGELIQTTPHHKFRSDRGWVEASALHRGTRVQKLDGTFGTVDRYSIEVSPAMMWDLSVADVHTFAVGEGKWVVHNDCGPSSTILRENLESAGFRGGADDAAHHIVAGTDPRAAAARRILEQLGVDINDAANGVFLPKNTNVPNPTGSAIHSTTHTSSYHASVVEALAGAKSNGDVIATLDAIRRRLLGGGYP